MSVMRSEGYTSGEFLIRETPGISRDIVTFDNLIGSSSLLVEAGTVIQQVPPGSAVVTPSIGNAGNGSLGSVQPNFVPVQFGSYKIAFTGPSGFNVIAPDGSFLQPGNVGVPYLDQVGFQISAGSAPFAPGDGATITIADGMAPSATLSAGNAGNGAVSNIESVESAVAEFGNYVIRFLTVSSTAFSVFSPSGKELLPGTVGTYYQDEIGFLLSAGTVPFAMGDGFTVGVLNGSGHVVAWNGSAPPVGVIYGTVYIPAGSSLQVTAIMRSAEVAASALRFPNGNPAASQRTAIAGLLALGIVAR